MKPSVLVCSLVLAVVAGAAAPRSPAERPRLTDEMRQQVAEDTAAANATAGSVGTDGESLILAPFKVTGPRLPPDRRNETPRPNQPFTFKDGGTFWQQRGRHVTTEAKFQYNPDHGGFDFLNFSW